MTRPHGAIPSPESASRAETSAPSYDQLVREFEAFEALPVHESSWQQRKGAVRSLEERVEAGSIALTSSQLRECRNGPLMLGRILTYLLVAQDRVASSLEECSKGVRNEWLRLQEKQPLTEVSRMPLHYALEAYLMWLRRNPVTRPRAADDSVLIRQIYDGLDSRPDHDQQPKRVICEIQALVAGGESAPPPAQRSDMGAAGETTKAARITARYALAGVIVAAVVGTLGAALFSNWDKIFAPKPAPATAPATSASSQTSSGTQSPNINSARDVTIQYGASAPGQTYMNVAGKWRSNVFASPAGTAFRSILLIELLQNNDQLMGTVTESDPDGSHAATFEIHDGKVAGAIVSFYTQSEVTTSDANRLQPYRESYLGTLQPTSSAMTMKRFTDIAGSEPESFVVKRAN